MLIHLHLKHCIYMQLARILSFIWSIEYICNSQDTILSFTSTVKNNFVKKYFLKNFYHENPIFRLKWLHHCFIFLAASFQNLLKLKREEPEWKPSSRIQCMILSLRKMRVPTSESWWTVRGIKISNVVLNITYLYSLWWHFIL